MVRLVDEVKKDLEYGKVQKNEEGYWKEIKSAAEGMIQEWESNNAELIRDYEKEYLERKLGKMSGVVKE